MARIHQPWHRRLLLWGLALGCFVTSVISMDELVGLIAAFCGLQTLAAAAFCFYFAKES